MNKLLIIKKSLASSITMMLTLAVLLSTVGSARAQENTTALDRNVPTMPSQEQGVTDPAELEAFLDELLGSQMEEHHIATLRIDMLKAKLLSNFKMSNVYQETGRTHGFTSQTYK